jgi:cell shape-determining protein MreD
VTPARLATALAAILTALLLQATLVSPAAITAQLSLPAVLVAAVALESGPGTGMSLGFATGLTADLASAHAAGVFALCWLAVGVGCGVLADARRRVLAQATIAAAACAVAGAAATLILAVIGDPGGTAGDAVRGLLPALLGDFVLALLIIPITRRFLRSAVLHLPAPGHG